MEKNMQETKKEKAEELRKYDGNLTKITEP
jgi:hypothetical protein